MADASDTMRYLVKSFDIAPAGTREEGQAAKGLSEVFHNHGLETANKSFRYSSLGNVPYAACAALVGIAGILSGIAGGVLPIVTLVIGLIAGALYVLDRVMGIKTVSRIGISGSSQNVVARHPSAAPAGVQKARPVVVIAHYDTPRADLFSIPQLAWMKPYLNTAVLVCMIADVVAMFLQVLPVPVVLHSIAWAVSIVSSALLLVWAVSVVLQRFAMPFTSGANDNKAALAAVIGLLDRVRPLQGGFAPSEEVYAAMGVEEPPAEVVEEVEEATVRSERRRPARSEGEGREGREDGGEARAARSSRTSRAAETPVPAPAGPVRYGADVMRSLGILPESCIIEYEDEQGSTVHRASSSAEDRVKQDTAVEGATIVMTMPADPSAQGDASADESSVVVAAEGDAAQVASAPEMTPEQSMDAAADAIMAGIVGGNALSGSQAPDGRPVPASAGETSMILPVGAASPSQTMAPARPFSVITSSDDYDAELRNAATQVPPDVAAQSAQASSAFFSDEPAAPASVVDDPMWGTSSFRPVGAGRRILSDIPDPAVAAIDPFSVSSIDPVGTYNPEDFSELDFETGTHQSVTPNMLEYERRRALDGFSADITESKRSRKSKKGHQGRISHQAARMQAQMQEESFNDWLGLDEGFDAKTSGRQIGSWDNFADEQSDPATQAAAAEQGAYGQMVPGAQYGQPGQPGQYPGDQQDGYGAGRAPRWQGGAARARRSTSRRLVDANENGPEVRRAAMTLGDRELIAHEIWFVLTGASEADHAGVEDFLKTYRAELRGAYFINLECVGAGQQSLVLEEGEGRHVKADRRLVNLFGDASVSINRPVALTRMNWRDTEATPLLRQGCRAVTVCGTEQDVPANAYWTGDTPEKVDPEMINDLVDVLVEVIKNA